MRDSLKPELINIKLFSMILELIQCGSLLFHAFNQSSIKSKIMRFFSGLNVVYFLLIGLSSASSEENKNDVSFPL